MVHRLCIPCSVIIIQVVLLVLFLIFVRNFKYTYNYHYPMFQDVHVMIFVGFGFLMTFLRRYGFSAVGFNFLLASFAIQWAILCEGFLNRPTGESKIVLTYHNLWSADIAAATTLISMGVVLGKTNYIQLLIMGLIEILFYSGNMHLNDKMYEAIDPGGSIFVHTFGAFFGLAMSFVHRKRMPEESSGSSYTSDLFAMLGTVFLWMFWPSFNAIELIGVQQSRAVINTYLSLTASCVVAFAVSAALHPEGKFEMTHIQNSTLAGGVGVGACGQLYNLHPYCAIIVGMLAGALSVTGYKFITPCLQNLGIHDTCGVCNLHGLPGILSAIVSAILMGIGNDNSKGEDTNYLSVPSLLAKAVENVTSTMYRENNDFRSEYPRTGGKQALSQIIALGATIVIAIVGGIISGLLTIFFPESEAPYDDSPYWEIPEV